VPLPDQDTKGKDNDDDEGDKARAQGYQNPTNVINIIFGGDSGFPSKCAQKLALREILSVKTAIQRPQRHSKVSIFFS
jgi:hypothetical protein